jgi:hypothetical protein
MDGLKPSDLDLRTWKLSAIPIINHYLKRMGIEDLISSRIDGGGLVTHSKCLMILLRNIILEREPVYGIGKWVSRFEPSLLGLSAEQLHHMNDDRVGRTLDVLFDAERASMLNMKSIPIYSEERECFSPTSGRILSEFHDLEVHRLVSHGNEVRRFYTESSDLQKLIMSLLGISEEEFRPK